MFRPKNSAVLFSLGFLFAYAIIGFYSEFVVFLLRSPNFAFPRCIHSDPCPSILYALFVLFFFYALYCFSRIFSLATGFLFSGIFAALPITSRALLAFCLQSSLCLSNNDFVQGFSRHLKFKLRFHLALLFSKVFCFTSFAAFFSHCLVLFPGHPFLIFTCFFFVRVSSPDFVYLICL